MEFKNLDLKIQLENEFIPMKKSERNFDMLQQVEMELLRFGMQLL